MELDSLDQSDHKIGKKLLLVIFVLSLINLIYLDASLFVKNKPNIVERLVVSPSSSDKFCPQSCLSQIKEATASHKLNITLTPTYTPTPTPIIQQTSSSSLKESYISFGGGSNSSDDWQDVPGLQTYINSSYYSKIKTITFEVSMRIPTGNEVAYARLFNSTDKHPVWFSEVSLEGGTPQFLISKPITLDSGNKLYQVQMKTTLKYQALIDQAKIHIISY